jgi:hypothetical protein
MNFKRTSKLFTGAWVCAALCAAIGTTTLASASQDAARDAQPSPALSKARTASNDRPDSLSRQNGKGGWTCPMHPDIHEHESGKCPICKMNLVKTKPKGA